MAKFQLHGAEWDIDNQADRIALKIFHYDRIIPDFLEQLEAAIEKVADDSGLVV